MIRTTKVVGIDIGGTKTHAIVGAQRPASAVDELVKPGSAVGRLRTQTSKTTTSME